jgi:hypothetical protein
MDWLKIVAAFAQIVAQLLPEVAAVVEAYRKSSAPSGPGGERVHALLGEQEPLKQALDRLSAKFPV